MNRSFLTALGPLSLAFLVASSVAVAQAPAPRSSGIDRTTADPAVRIQDDAFRAVNGHWLATTQIPADRSGIGQFLKLRDLSQSRSRELIEGFATTSATPIADADAQKIADLYASFMNVSRADGLGLQPIAADLARIDAIASRDDLAAMFATLDRIGVDVPFTMYVHLDAKDSTRYVVDLQQGGIGLPNRDYFLSTTDRRFADVRAKYRTYLERLLDAAGDAQAAAHAKDVLALETRIARAQWDAVAVRDAVRTYNMVSVAQLPTLAPHIGWSAYLHAATLEGRTDRIVISEPGFVRGLDRALVDVPLPVWKAYLKTRLLTAYAPDLDQRLVDLQFAFVDTVLRGTPENQPRWQRGVNLVEKSIGEGLGRLYVARFFPDENKARVDALVKNLLAAYKTSIDGLDWMGPATRRRHRPSSRPSRRRSAIRRRGGTTRSSPSIATTSSATCSARGASSRTAISASSASRSTGPSGT